METAAVITAVAVLVTALSGMLLGIMRELRLLRSATNRALLGIEEVHLATNSMKDELVEAVRQSATLQGAKDERTAQAARDAKPEGR